MKEISWKDRWNYRFDVLMAKGTPALIGGLAILSIVFILIMAGVVSMAEIRPPDGEKLDFFEASWQSLMRTLDAGTMGGDEGWFFRISMLVVTLGGVFIISTLIGVLTSGIEARMDSLRKGRSRVIESGHTVVLGWSEKIFPILSELKIANANQPRACIVILGNEEKLVMEDRIRSVIGSGSKNMQVICRSGNPCDPNDLELVCLPTARSVIVLAPDTENPDTFTIKSLLAITNVVNRDTGWFHIVAEIQDPNHMHPASLINPDQIVLIKSDQLIARITAQTCRQSGLSAVFTELLNFDGDEIYIKRIPELTGRTFGEALMAFRDSAVLGICFSDGNVRLNPPIDTRLQENDQIVIIAEDDDTIQYDGHTSPQVNEDSIRETIPFVPSPEHTLLLGWNRRARQVILELDNYVQAGSRVTVVADQPGVEKEIRSLQTSLSHQDVEFCLGDTTERHILDRLDIKSYQHIITLCCSDQLDVQEADARTLVTLLQLRDISRIEGHPFSIVSEIMDVRNRVLAENTQADDFIVSEHLVSLLLTQVSESKALHPVFEDLFDPEGSEVNLKPAEDYVCLGKPVNFYTVLESAQRRNQIAFGYRLKAHANDPGKSYGVVINPEKDIPVAFSSGDRVIVLAEE